MWSKQILWFTAYRNYRSLLDERSRIFWITRTSLVAPIQLALPHCQQKCTVSTLFCLCFQPKNINPFLNSFPHQGSTVSLQGGCCWRDTVLLSWPILTAMRPLIINLATLQFAHSQPLRREHACICVQSMDGSIIDSSEMPAPNAVWHSRHTVHTHSNTPERLIN